MMKNSNYLVVLVVLYNINIITSPVIKRCEEESLYLNLLIVDNSNQPDVFCKNKEYCLDHKIHYIGDGVNNGLSRAYNKAIRYLTDNQIKYDYISIFDQDTIMPETYFSELIEKIGNRREEDPILFFPTVITSSDTKRAVLSPRNIFHTREKDTFYINSGIILSRILVETCKYNEEMFLDFVDYDYLLQIRTEFGSSLREISLNSELVQEFSGSRFSNMANDYSRYRIFVKDLRIFAKKWKRYQWRSYYFLLKRCIHLTIHYASFKYIQLLLSSGR
jgi:GT2 family glycosyltransferase